MITKEEILIRKSILHVLDTTRGDCILSNTLLEPGPDLYEFIRTHIFRILTSDDAKDCEFNRENSPICSILETWDESDEASFIESSRIIAEKLYVSMGECQDVPPADLLFVSFKAQDMIQLAMLKLNYRESYTHDILFTQPAEDEDDPVTEEPVDPSCQAKVVVSRSLFPSVSMRLPEAIIINLSDLHIRLIEKMFEANGKKINYLSEKFLICHTQLPPKKKLSVLTRVIRNIANEYDGTDFEAKMDSKSLLQKAYAKDKVFDVEKIGSSLYADDMAKRSKYDEQMEKYDLQFDRFSVNNDRTVQKLDRQVLKTDTGIEISIPMDIYNRRSSIEVKTDVGGMTTIILSNISELTLK